MVQCISEYMDIIEAIPFPMKMFKKTVSTSQTSDMIWNYLHFWLLLLLSTNVIIHQSKTVRLFYSVYQQEVL